MVWLPDGERKFEDRLRIVVSTQCRRVSDGHTDRQAGRQTSCDSIVRAMHSICGKKGGMRACLCPSVCSSVACIANNFGLR